MDAEALRIILQQAAAMPQTPTASPPVLPPGFQLDNSVMSSPEFRMFCYKIVPCTRRYGHDWTACPFAHPGEKAMRRCPQRFQYLPLACPDFKKAGECPRGETCMFAHNVFEYWLHPMRYRTQLCSYGPDCKRGICFFAHSYNELRVVDQTQLQELERQLDVLGDGSTTFGFPSANTRSNNASGQQGGHGAQGPQRTQSVGAAQQQHKSSRSPSSNGAAAAPAPDTAADVSPAALLMQLQLQLQQQERAQQQQQQQAAAAAAAQATPSASQLSQQDRILQAAQLLGVDPSSLAQFQTQQAAMRARSSSTPTTTGGNPNQSALLQAAMQLLGPSGAQALTAVASRMQQASGFGGEGGSVAQPATPPHGASHQLGTPLQSLTNYASLTPVASLSADVDQMAATMKLLADMGLAPRQQAQAAEAAAAAMARAAATPRASLDFSAHALLQPTASLDSSLDSAGSSSAVSQLIMQLQNLSSKLNGGAPTAPPPAPPAPAPPPLSALAQTYSLPANAFSSAAAAGGTDMQAVMSLLPLLAKQLAGGAVPPAAPAPTSAAASPAHTPTMALLTKQVSQQSNATNLTGAFGGASGLASAAAAAAAAVGASPLAPATPMSSGNGSAGGAAPPTSSPIGPSVTPTHGTHHMHATLHPAKPSATLSITNSLSPVDVLSIRSHRSGVINSSTVSCAGSEDSSSPPPSAAEHAHLGMSGLSASSTHPEHVENVEMDDLVAHPELLGANRMLQSLSLLVSGGSEGIQQEDQVHVPGVGSGVGSSAGSKPTTLSGDSAAALLGTIGDKMGTPRPSVDLSRLPISL